MLYRDVLLHDLHVITIESWKYSLITQILKLFYIMLTLTTVTEQNVNHVLSAYEETMLTWVAYTKTHVLLYKTCSLWNRLQLYQLTKHQYKRWISYQISLEYLSLIVIQFQIILVWTKTLNKDIIGMELIIKDNKWSLFKNKKNYKCFSSTNNWSIYILRISIKFIHY